MRPIPTLVIAGAGSGVGKTTATCAIACALAARGLDVRLFKAGPDYLDTTFHRAALGRRSRNLDAWMMGREGVREAFAAGSAGGEVALIEGMMGLYDGRDPASVVGSSAQLAEWLGAPVALVVDAVGVARSGAAIVEGFAHHRPATRVEAALFNQVGGPRHAPLLETALAAGRFPGPMRSLGGLPRREDLYLPSRHLGLLAAEFAEPTRTEAARARWRRTLAGWAAEHLDLDGLLEVAATARGPGAPTRPPPPRAARARIGVARDEAFLRRRVEPPLASLPVGLHG